MILEWTEKAIADVERQRAFLAEVNPYAADRVATAILSAAASLSQFPRTGRAAEGADVRVKIETR